jgi:hypothetical protein
MATNSHQGTGGSSGFRTVAVVGLAVAYVAFVLAGVGLLSPVFGVTDLSTTAATLVVAGLLFPLWRRLAAAINRRPAWQREQRTQMTLRGIARRVVAGLLALAVYIVFILVFLGWLAPFTSEWTDLLVPLATLGAAAVFIIALQRLPR